MSEDFHSRVVFTHTEMHPDYLYILKCIKLILEAALKLKLPGPEKQVKTKPFNTPMEVYRAICAFHFHEPCFHLICIGHLVASSLSIWDTINTDSGTVAMSSTTGRLVIVIIHLGRTTPCTQSHRLALVDTI